MDVGASRQIQSREVNQTPSRAVQTVSPAEQSSVNASQAERRGEPAATLELSSAAVAATQTSSLGSTVEAVENAQSSTAVVEPAATPEVDVTSRQSAPSSFGTGGAAASVRIGGAARQMAENSETGEVAPEQMEARAETRVSPEADPADPGISADNLGVVEDAGRPN